MRICNVKKSDANTEYQTSNTNANLGRGWWHCQILAAAAAAGMAVRWCSAAAAAAAAQTRMRMRTPSRLVMSMGCPARTMALEHTNKQTNKQANKHMHVSTTARSSVSHTTLVCSGAARAVEDRVAAHRLQIFHRPLNVPKRSSQGLRRLYSVTCVCMCVCVCLPLNLTASLHLCETIALSPQNKTHRYAHAHSARDTFSRSKPMAVSVLTASAPPGTPGWMARGGRV